MTYTKLFPLLLEQKLIELVLLKPLEPPYPRSYDPNARCDYYGGVIGHATERCWSLKHKVQDLLDDELLGFEDKGPNVHNNPLSAHDTASVNTLSHTDEGVVSPNRRKDREPGLTVDPTSQVEEGSHLYQSNDGTIAPKHVPFIIQVSTKPIYNNNAILWKYPTLQIKEETTEITNIVGTGGMTRSGRIFSPDTLRNKESSPTKKEKTIEPPKRTVTEKEAQESLSEYEMLDQLQKTLACISLLSLLINSESHRELLLKIPNEAHVPQDITPAKFGGIINNITASRHLSFSEEVSDEGRNHNQPLHIAVKCGNYMIARVLIDNGSSLNVMPKSTLDKLYCPGAILRNSPVVVRAFNGSKREVMGKITLPINVGPTTFDITFQVMDIRPAYSCLLG
ncbi:hypothetical protein CR513_07434, partial [Mucuna pruriens]